MGRILTLRGVLSKADKERIMMFDSNVTSTGWKILDFQVMNQGLGRYDIIGVLSTDPNGVYQFADWDPNQVVGICEISTTGNKNLLLDYNHVIVNSLYLTNPDDTYNMNYLVVLEEIKIDPKLNIMYQLKESAQS